jgi:protein O-mannosyl-transferase
MHKHIESLSGPKATPLVSLLLIVAILGVYGQVAGHYPIPMDDDIYYTTNAKVQMGFTWESFTWAWTNVDAANWHPLTWLSHMFDKEFFGEKIGAVMFHNVFWHTANCLLLYRLFVKFFTYQWVSFALTLIFALHPQNVESVAWMSQRKTLIATFFLLYSILFYIDWRHTGKKLYTILAISFFSLSLTAKSMGVCLPVILFAAESLNLFRAQKIPEDSKGKLLAKSLYCLKLTSAYWVVATTIAVITFLAQRNAGAMPSIELVSLSDRFLNIGRAFATHLGNFISPGELTLYYPFKDDVSVREGLNGYWLMLFISVNAFLFRSISPKITLGWIWFVVAMLPTIGIVQVGSQSHADRYMYLPMMGLLLTVGGMISPLNSIVQGKIKLIPWLVFACSAFGLGLGCNSYAYLRYWENGETAYLRSIQLNGASYIMVSALSYDLSHRGFLYSAIRYAEQAHSISPQHRLASSNLGMFYAEFGDYNKALKYCQEAVKIHPNWAPSHFNLGLVYASKGETELAREHFVNAYKLLPESSSDIGIVKMKNKLNDIEGLIKYNSPKN